MISVFLSRIEPAVPEVRESQRPRHRLVSAAPRRLRSRRLRGSSLARRQSPRALRLPAGPPRLLLRVECGEVNVRHCRRSVPDPVSRCKTYSLGLHSDREYSLRSCSRPPTRTGVRCISPRPRPASWPPACSRRTRNSVPISPAADRSSSSRSRPRCRAGARPRRADPGRLAALLDGEDPDLDSIPIDIADRPAWDRLVLDGVGRSPAARPRATARSRRGSAGREPRGPSAGRWVAARSACSSRATG